MLQLYRLYVVHSENKANERKKLLEAQKSSRKRNDLSEMNQFNDIYIISSGKLDDKRRNKRYWRKAPAGICEQVNIVCSRVMRVKDFLN